MRKPKKQKLSILSNMDEIELRFWLRSVWSYLYPNHSSNWYDVWEKDFWTFVVLGFPKFVITPKAMEKEQMIVSEMTTLLHRIRRITCTIKRQPPYQAIKP